ncbi:MAG: hypothetical protein JXA44_09220 [Methanospirillaceae archaeon]|nr:hypothetical protein [Methanospirillaceae archaeon]
MRRNHRIFTTGLTSVIIIACLAGPVFALTAGYHVSEDGTRYQALIEITDKDTYSFFDTGMLGERVPFEVSNLSLLYNGEEAPFEKTRDGIRFARGDYILSFDRTVPANQVQGHYDESYTSMVTLPSQFRIDNPLLTVISPSSYSIEHHPNNTTTISWTDSRFFEVKYYSEEQLQALYAFAQFWLIIAIVLLLPYYLYGRVGSPDPPEKE